MPVKNYSSQRYKVIDALLSSPIRKYPSLEEIADVCEERIGKRPSIETLSKDLRQMRKSPPAGFDAPIEWSKKYSGYFYDAPEFTIENTGLNDHDIDALKEAIDLMRSVGGARVGSKFSHALEKVLSSYKERFPQSDYHRTIIQTDTPPPSRGFEHFDLLFRACKDRKAVSFVHYSYRKQRFKPILLHPVLMKEFDNKWYVVGYSDYHDDIRTFGLDRIYEPHMVYATYIESDPKEISAYINDIYGVYPLNDREKIQITIRASALASNYIQAYPIHESQAIKEKADIGTTTFTFDLIPSMELLSYFMSYGRDITVISPRWMSHLIHFKQQRP